ncbi:hypothetical protein BJ684DRAFT_19207 [Piptocephalis cylindrospora]|uniref:Protein kinase domain-containing protein n=1 Tax=Piptocephalis cylindrospora TaxID=1907219 RepID=A0A4P9Y5S2_9FUNG|nr:hypothetical protein BJ684DRAFT_19207 [Piptocephalis cylindrospora]|eukprot:RKP14386.1 hypothetical protein BJ684DRAFT_19207 [Piptocephalis cylindrospora]
MTTHALDMFSCGQIIHWMASSAPIWGEEDPTHAFMAHMLCQASEFPIASSNFAQPPVYHLVVGLLQKDPAEHLNLKAIRKRLYFSSILDTRVVSDLLKERLAVKDIEAGEGKEDGAGAVAIPEENDSIFINFSWYIRHHGLRRIWSTDGWDRQALSETLVESLKNHLAIDVAAFEALDRFMDEFFPPLGGNYVTIEQINEVFLKVISKY